MAHLPLAVRDQIADLLAEGRKIEAIKVHRQATGSSLADAKESIEALQDQLTRSGESNESSGSTDPGPSHRRTPGNDPQLADRLLGILRTEGKIAAIKEHRQATGLGLKESKEAVEALAAGASSAPGPRRRNGANETVKVTRGCAGGLLLIASLATFLALAGHLPFTTSARAVTREDPDIEAVLQQRAASNQALVERDFETFQAILDDEYQITRGNGGFGDATQSARMVRDLLASKPYTLYVRTPAAVEVGSDGQRAFESGSWVGSATSGGNGRRLGGRYSAYWRKIEGAWKIHAELFVTLFCDGSGCN